MIDSVIGDVFGYLADGSDSLKGGGGVGGGSG